MLSTENREQQPYFSIIGELMRQFIKFGKLVEVRRPETAVIPGIFIMTIDASTGSVVFGKRLSNETVVVIEQVRCDPRDPSSFGASELPIVVPDGGAVQH